MALSVVRERKELPSDVVELSRDEALKYQILLVQKWEPRSEV